MRSLSKCARSTMGSSCLSPEGPSGQTGSRRHFRAFLRRDKRRVHVCTMTCGSENLERSQVTIEFPEKALLRPAGEAIEYEDCRRDAKRYAAHFPKDRTLVGGRDSQFRTAVGADRHASSVATASG